MRFPALRLLLLAAVPLLVLVAASPAASAAACSNEALRTGPSAALPDCRAYELVSPLLSEPEAASAHTIPVSLTGDRVGFYSQFGPAPGFAGASPGPYYLSARGPAGWSTADQVPPQSTVSGLFCSAVVAGYSADLSRAVLADGWNWSGYPQRPDDTGTTTSCGHDEPLLVPGEGQGAQNMFLHETGAANEAGFYQLLNQTPLGVGARDAYFQAGSADFSHIVFTSPLQLTPEAPLPPEQTSTQSVGEDVYETAGGTVHLVTVLPGGVPTWGILANGWESNEAPTSASFTNAVSEDGERVFFYGHGEQYCENGLKGATGTACTGEGAYLNANLYLRENVAQEPGAGGECSPAEAGRGCTIQIDKANSDAPAGPGGAGQLQWATPDGSRVFFTDCARLTADATAVSSGGCGGFAKEQNSYEQPKGNDLYEYDVARPSGQRLTDLTVDSHGSDSLAADVQGVAGISKDGSHVYFVARGVLTGGEENARHEKAAAGETNLYLRHAGATTFIAVLGPPISGEALHNGVKGQLEACDWASATTPERGPGSHPGVPSAPCLTSRVSADGRFLAFNSRRSLTGYDSTVAATGVPSFEMFRYDATARELSCASCNPEGHPATAAETFQQPSILPPLLTGEQWGFGAQVLSSQLAEDGKVFFSTTDSLLPADENTGSDVYEYDGSLHLLSAGTGSSESWFRNASPDGSNVFFTTAAALVGTDTDNATSLYDARVGGGFPEPAAPAPACDESTVACRAPVPSTPAGSAPASATFTGPGNPVIVPVKPKPPPKPFHCRKGFKKAKVHGRTVCRKTPKRRVRNNTARRALATSVGAHTRQTNKGWSNNA